MEATKNICCAKGESAVNHSRVIRWFKKFCLGCKSLEEHATSGRLKNMDAEALCQAVEANMVSST